LHHRKIDETTIKPNEARIHHFQHRSMSAATSIDFFVYCRNAQYPVIHQKMTVALFFVAGRDSETGGANRTHEDRRHVARQQAHQVSMLENFFRARNKMR